MFSFVSSAYPFAKGQEPSFRHQLSINRHLLFKELLFPLGAGLSSTPYYEYFVTRTSKLLSELISLHKPVIFSPFLQLLIVKYLVRLHVITYPFRSRIKQCATVKNVFYELLIVFSRWHNYVVKIVFKKPECTCHPGITIKPSPKNLYEAQGRYLLSG